MRISSPLERISVDPTICYGVPCIRGTRVQVSSILDLLARGMNAEQVIDRFPQITLQDVEVVMLFRQSMLSGLQLMRGRGPEV